MRLEQVQHWLRVTALNNEQLSPSAPTAPTAEGDRAVKRRRPNPISPPPSDTHPDHAGDMASPARSDGPSKRSLNDETPRAKRVQTSMSERSYPSLSSASSDQSPSSSRRHGRTPSPQKQLRALQLNPRGLDVRDMYNVEDTNNRPRALQALLDDIEAFSDGQGIVARDAQDALGQAAESDLRFAWALRGGASHISDNPSLVGRTPPPGAVRRLMEAAFECSSKRHPEANWNLEVHQQILNMAFRREEESDFKNLVNFMGSTTASIIPEYGIPTLSKKVDFCVYIDPKNDPLLSPAFGNKASYARAAMPQGILNFTDFAPLYDRFVALSIETKKPSEDFEAAQLQLGVWDMARWSFLRRLVELQSTTTGATVAVDAGANDAEQAKLPAFLPGIIVQGHDWFLVITTMERDKTVLWQKVAIGSTSKPRGVYQIVRTLQYLERWAQDVHWPWLRALIEGIPGDDA